jgi:hypothetical protein
LKHANAFALPLPKKATYVGLVTAFSHPRAEYLGFGLEPMEEALPFLVEEGLLPAETMAWFDLVIETDRAGWQCDIHGAFSTILGASYEIQGFRCARIIVTDETCTTQLYHMKKRQYPEKLYGGIRMHAALKMRFSTALTWRNVVQELLAPETLRHIEHKRVSPSVLENSKLMVRPLKSWEELYGS